MLHRLVLKIVRHQVQLSIAEPEPIEHHRHRGLAYTHASAVFSCLLAIIEAVTFTNADVLRGQNNEFLAIVAAVIGGVLLTGGYGSAIGSMFGALALGIVEEGVVFAGVNADWYKAFIGLILLLAVLLNNYVRKLAMEVRR